MLTIVIASYRYGHLAAHCIESILSQTKAPEKILFVDDGVGDCGHLEGVTCLTFNPQGSLIATGSVDSSYRLWDVRTGRTIHIGQAMQNRYALLISTGMVPKC